MYISCLHNYILTRDVARGPRGRPVAQQATLLEILAFCSNFSILLQILAFCLPRCPQMRSRSCNFQKKSGSPARRVAPGPSLNRLKSKKSTCVPLKTLKLKVLWEEGTKLISIAKLHLEVLRVEQTRFARPKTSPHGQLASLAH